MTGAPGGAQDDGSVLPWPIGFGVVAVPARPVSGPCASTLPTGTAVAGNTCVVMLLAVLTARGLYRSAGTPWRRGACGDAAGVQLSDAQRSVRLRTGRPRGGCKSFSRKSTTCAKAWPISKWRLPGALMLNPEMRVEGNFQGKLSCRWSGAPGPEQEGFSNNRFNLREVENRPSCLGGSVLPFWRRSSAPSIWRRSSLRTGEEELEAPPGEVEFEEGPTWTFCAAAAQPARQDRSDAYQLWRIQRRRPGRISPRSTRQNIITQTLWRRRARAGRSPAVKRGTTSSPSPFSEKNDARPCGSALYSGENGTAFPRRAANQSPVPGFTRLELFYEVAAAGGGWNSGSATPGVKRLDNYFDDMMNGMIDREDDDDDDDDNGHARSR